MVRLPLCDQDSSFHFYKTRKLRTGSFTDGWVVVKSGQIMGTDKKDK